MRTAYLNEGAYPYQSARLSSIKCFLGVHHFYRDPNGILYTAVLQDNIDKMVDLGFLKAAIDVKNYADFTIVREAGARPK